MSSTNLIVASHDSHGHVHVSKEWASTEQYSCPVHTNVVVSVTFWTWAMAASIY